jgi:hypothetical protein
VSALRAVGATLAALALGALSACAGPRPSGLAEPLAEGPALLVKSVRLPKSEPWHTRFARHTFFDLRPRSQGPWLRLEVLNPSSGVLLTVLDEAEVFADQRWGRSVEVLAARAGPEAARIARELLDRGPAQHLVYLEGYRGFPGPNSNTFADALVRATPDFGVLLDHNAVGKDWAWPARVGRSATGTGVELELPLLGLQLGLNEGVELHLLGLTLGVGLVPPTVKLPLLPPLRLSSRVTLYEREF